MRMGEKTDVELEEIIRNPREHGAQVVEMAKIILDGRGSDSAEDADLLGGVKI